MAHGASGRGRLMDGCAGRLCNNQDNGEIRQTGQGTNLVPQFKFASSKRAKRT